jgi:hypothetical protein
VGFLEIFVTLTTSIAIAHALGISYTELAAAYDKITEEDTQVFVQILEAQKKNKDKAKLPLSPPKKDGKKKKSGKMIASVRRAAQNPQQRPNCAENLKEGLFNYFYSCRRKPVNYAGYPQMGEEQIYDNFKALISK